MRMSYIYLRTGATQGIPQWEQASPSRKQWIEVLLEAGSRDYHPEVRCTPQILPYSGELLDSATKRMPKFLESPPHLLRFRWLEYSEVGRSLGTLAVPNETMQRVVRRLLTKVKSFHQSNT